MTGALSTGQSCWRGYLWDFQQIDGHGGHYNVIIHPAKGTGSLKVTPKSFIATVIRKPVKEVEAVSKVREVFTAALACNDSRSREELLNHECGEDDALREMVQSLLEEATVAGDFLERPAVEDPTRGRGSNEVVDFPGENLGDEIGSYRLVELVGEGGGRLALLAERGQGPAGGHRA